VTTVDLGNLTGFARSPRAARLFVGLAAGFVLSAGVTWSVLSMAWPVAPVHVHVRWKGDVPEPERLDLERRFRLTDPRTSDGASWEYLLVDASTANIRALVQNPRVDDTEHLNRIRYRPEFAQDRSRQILACSLVAGAVGSVLLVVAVGVGHTMRLRGSWPAPTPALSSTRASTHTRPNYSIRVTAAVGLAAIAAAIAMAALAGAAVWSALAALAVLYVCGYVVGALLLDRIDEEFGLSWAIIRTVSGLLLSTVAFLLALVLSVPWFIAPVTLIAAVMYLRGREACAWPHGVARFRWDYVGAAVLVAALIAPIALSFLYMAPGSFPPVLYNIDTAYFLEKVHALVSANGYPPDSLSNVGIRRTYHYGTQAMAALISRSSGLLPHHSLFLLVLPLLTAGVVASAVAVVRYVSPNVPRTVAVPLLLISIPSFVNSFWNTFGPRLWNAAVSGGFSAAGLVGDYGLWGFLSNEGQNIGGDFMVLSSVAGIAAAPFFGWALPAFLIGSAILVKTPLGIALVAGFVLADGWRAFVSKRFLPSSQALAVVGVFIVIFMAFFVVRLESNFRVEPFLLFHLNDVVQRGSFPGFAFDLLWLLLPAMIALSAGVGDPEKCSAPILIMALAPLLVVNITRMDNVIAGGGGTGGDWLQILHAGPFLLHAFALSVASRRWYRLGPVRRASVLLALALAVLPVAAVAARYTVQLVSDPESGHEFVDNRSLAEALVAIPTTGTVIVTNDLRYPAQNFTRDYRQMQIPALFGHQAFAVNYAHEAVEERRPLQQLLQQPAWSEAIMEAARLHRWTHLLIRKDYVHPTPIPLERVFENRSYAVFRFPANLQPQ
jgi:hypothetical protein